MESIFGKNNIRNFKTENFTEGDITLKDGGCYVILFYENSDESDLLLNIFKSSCEYVSNRNTGMCNLEEEREIFDKLSNIVTNSSERYNNLFKDVSIPFILIYLNGEPVTVFKRFKTVSSITDLILSQTCRKNSLF